MKHAAAVGAALAITLTGATAGISGPSALASTVTLPSYSAVVNASKLAANYYRTTYAHTTVTPTNGWSWSTYTKGVLALFEQAGDQHFLSDELAWGQSNAWGISNESDPPNRLTAAQTYDDLAALSSTVSLTAADSAMASNLTSLPVSQYYYADSLFVGLPAWTRWATRTGNSAYLAGLDAMYAWARDEGGTSSLCKGKAVPSTGLFDATQGLWYRDCRFDGATDTAGKPIFWARGNGWVIAAMAQVLATLPAGDPRAATYASMLQTMAARLAHLQGSDGLWRSNLLDPSLYPSPETSGSALITYALAYGIKAGILNSATYLPVVAKAWHGLTTISLQPSGFVTDCQGPDSAPGAPYTANSPRINQSSTSSGTVNLDSPPYCVGALLLAGAQVAQLITSPSTGRPAVATGQPVVGYGANRVNDGDVTTRWSVSGFPQSVTIDLGSNKSLSNAKVVPYLDRAYRYRVQTSTDNKNWTTVINRTTNTLTGSRLDTFTTGPVNARYVRLTVVGVYGVSTSWVSIQEFAVYP
jgi:rhamnogalacturonyl hydrolase YesR